MLSEARVWLAYVNRKKKKGCACSPVSFFNEIAVTAIVSICMGGVY